MLIPVIEQYQEFSESEVDVFREVIRPDDVILEAGSNIGAHTLALSELVPRGKVYAIEPQRLIFQTLCANMALNSVTNVVTLNTVLGAALGEMSLLEIDPHVSMNFGNFSTQNQGAEGVQTPVLTIDSMAFSRLDFIKLDAEGAEVEILTGAVDTITRCRPAVYLEYDTNRQKIMDFFLLAGYVLARHQPKHAPQARTNAPGYGVASDMVLAWPPERPCSAGMANGTFGARMQFKAANTEDVLLKGQ